MGEAVFLNQAEVTLSHNGVLFLDELPEFSRMALEVLRQPLEDGFVTIRPKVQATLSFPATFILVSAENPCPCGFYGETDGIHECICRIGDIERYHKISGPLLDRIDIQIHVPRLEYNEMKADNRSECSADIRKRVIAARKLQLKRLQGTGLHCNAEMSRREIKKKMSYDTTDRAATRKKHL